MLTLVAAVLGPISAFAAFGASAVSSYYRGYLIPGTPELTQRYLPDPVLAAFGRASGVERRETVGTVTAVPTAPAVSAVTATSRETGASRRADRHENVPAIELPACVG